MRRRFINTKSFDENDYLTFVCLEDNSTIAFTKDIYYSLNGGMWIKLYSNTPIRVTSGTHISFKENFREIDDMYGIGYFVSEGKFNIAGNINSLIFGDNAKNQTDLSSYIGVFRNLFVRNASIVDASLLSLPATTLARGCYYSMFSDCTSLTAAPELPATTLARDCYSSMFFDCTSLTAAPELPATTLARGCYSSMFSDCSKLNYIKMLATDISAELCLNFWVRNVSPTGTFVKNPDATWDVVGDNGVPSGWTVKFDGEEDVKLLEFTVDGIAYQFEEGMTWKEWCNSKYNTAGFIYDWSENVNGIYTSDYKKYFIYGLYDSSLVTTGVYLTKKVDWPMQI